MQNDAFQKGIVRLQFARSVIRFGGLIMPLEFVQAEPRAGVALHKIRHQCQCALIRRQRVAITAEPEQGVALVVMRRDIVRLQRDRLVEIGERGLEILEIVVNRAAVAQRFSIVRIEREGLRELSEGFIGAAERLECEPVIVQRGMGVRIEPDRRPQEPLGFVMLSGPDQNGAEYAQCQRMVGCPAQQPAQGLFGLVRPPGLQKRHCFTENDVGCGHDRSR